MLARVVHEIIFFLIYYLCVYLDILFEEFSLKFYDKIEISFA
jgi:hypothetical protein